MLNFSILDHIHIDPMQTLYNTNCTKVLAAPMYTWCTLGSVLD